MDGFSNHDWRQTTALLRGILEPSGLFTVILSTARPPPSPGWEQWRPKFSDHDVVVKPAMTLVAGFLAAVQLALRSSSRMGVVLVFHLATMRFGLGGVQPHDRAGLAQAEQGDAPDDKTPRKRQARGDCPIPAGQGQDTGHDGRSEVVVHRWRRSIHHGMPAPGRRQRWKFITTRADRRNIRVLYGYDKHTGMNWP